MWVCRFDKSGRTGRPAADFPILDVKLPFFQGTKAELDFCTFNNNI